MEGQPKPPQKAEETPEVEFGKVYAIENDDGTCSVNGIRLEVVPLDTDVVDRCQSHEWLLVGDHPGQMTAVGVNKVDEFLSNRSLKNPLVAIPAAE